MATSKNVGLWYSNRIYLPIQPFENLALSTQCGFASTEEGNDLSEEEEWAKLAHIKKIVDKIWK